jgi:proteic killer suppression protein
LIASFADVTTKDIWNGLETKAARRIPKVIWPVVRRKLDLLNRVDRLDALRVPPGNRLEALRGARVGSYSIRVNDQYRITFRFREDSAHDVRCEDYHPHG